MVRRQRVILFDFSLDFFDHLQNYIIIGVVLLALLKDCVRFVKLLLVFEGLGLSVVRFGKGGLDFDGLVAVFDALLQLAHFEVGIGPVGVVDVIWLLDRDFDRHRVLVYCLLVVFGGKCFVTCFFQRVWVVFVHSFFLTHFYYNKS